MSELAKEVLRVGAHRDLKAGEIDARVAAEKAQISDNELLKIIAQNQVDIAERLNYIRQFLKFISMAVLVAAVVLVMIDTGLMAVPDWW